MIMQLIIVLLSVYTMESKHYKQRCTCAFTCQLVLFYCVPSKAAREAEQFRLSPRKVSEEKKQSWQSGRITLSIFASTTACRVPFNMGKANEQDLVYNSYHYICMMIVQNFMIMPTNNLEVEVVLELSSDGNSKELAIILPPTAGYTILFLKSIMGHAKVYI